MNKLMIDIVCIAMITIVVFYFTCAFISAKIINNKCKECKIDNCYCPFCSNGPYDSIFREFITGFKFIFKINQQ